MGMMLDGPDQYVLKTGQDGGEALCAELSLNDTTADALKCSAVDGADGANGVDSLNIATFPNVIKTAAFSDLPSGELAAFQGSSSRHSKW